MKIIISILSDQLIPAVLFIKQMSTAGDKHVFITTRQMEKKQKSSILSETLALAKDDFETLEIDPNKPLRILEQLSAFQLPENDQYIVNITGGKIAEAVYKISSVSQSLGLQATSLVAILTPFGKSAMRKSFLEDISRLMRVKKVFSLEDIRDKKRFLEKIREVIR